MYSGRNILRFLPPLVISGQDIAKVLETLDDLFPGRSGAIMFKDKTDEKIIEFLRNDSRESFVDIGKKLKLSESAVRRRVKNLIDGKIITKFTINIGERTPQGHSARLSRLDD